MVNTYSIPPENINTLGFKYAPISKILLVSSSISSVTVAFLVPRYYGQLSLHWPDVLFRRQLWRLMTSQFISDNSYDLLCSCTMLYHFLVLERRWGSSRYMAYLLYSWCMTMGFYFLILKSKVLDNYVDNLVMSPSGLYGPLFALFFRYVQEVPATEKNKLFGISVYSKTLIYIISLQVFITNWKTAIMSSCGMLAGLLYRMNIFNIQNWLRIPSPISFLVSSIFGGMFGEDCVRYRQTYMGATEEIHEDILFDYHIKRQQQFVNRMRPGNPQDNAVGQGFADVMSPSAAQLFQNLMQQPTNQMPGLNQQVFRDGPAPPVPVVEEKVQTLVEMGFARDDVINALSSTNNDVQAATGILISST